MAAADTDTAALPSRADMTVVIDRVPFTLQGSGQESTMPSFFLGADWFPAYPPVDQAHGDYAGNHQRNWWHWQAQIPAMPSSVGWISMFTSILGLSVGKTGWQNQIGLPGGGPNYLFRAYSVDSPGTPQVIGSNLAGVWSLDYPAAQPTSIANPMVLIGQPYVEAGSIDAASIGAWEEYWLTEGVGHGDYLGGVTKRSPGRLINSIVRLPNQRSSGGIEWFEPSWRVPVAGGGLGYFVPPFPMTVDYWFAQHAYTDTGVYDTLTGYVPPGSPMSPPPIGWASTSENPDPPAVYPAQWDFPLLELIILGCSPGWIESLPGPQGVRRRGRLIGGQGPAKL